MDLALEFLGLVGQPNRLAPRRGLPERERMRLQQFISGLKVTTPHNQHDPGRRRMVKKLSRVGAREISFDIEDGGSMTVAEYFQHRLNGPLQFPDVICVEVCVCFS
jgi:eukaryotic translation initiation factor 2C